MADHSDHRPYSWFASLYDWVMDDVKYDMWADYVCRIIDRYGIRGKSLLDLACGTGNTSFTMAQRGFRVTGVDLSPEMISVATAKLEGSPDGVQAFLCQDMRQLDLGLKFDVVTCLFDSINYITDPRELSTVFSRAKAHMKPHGLFVFDVNSEYQLSRMTASSPTLFEKGEDVALFWRDEWCKATKIWRVYLDGFIKQGGSYHRVREVHEERAYPIDEIENALAHAGFGRVMSYDAYTFAPPRANSGRLFFVVRI